MRTKGGVGMKLRDGCHVYQMHVKLDPRHQELQVKAKLTYHVGEKGDAVVLYLHRDFQIHSLGCKGLKEYWLDREAVTCPFTPEAGELRVVLEEPLQRGDVLELELHYSGKIGIVSKWTVNRITPEWVELGLYTPWFPLTPTLERFTYEVKLQISAEYNVTGSGVVEEEGDSWLLIGESPDRDCVIVASRDLRNVEMVKDGREVSVNYTNPSEDKLAEDLLSSGMWILQQYSQLFGPIEGNRATLVIAPRSEGGGYARRGFIVLTPMEKGNDLLSYFRYMAHEFGHLWWWRAPSDTWEDWLNESFAEYAAMMAVRERFGAEAFGRFISSREAASVNVPPIRGLKRRDENAEKVLYGKGVMLLNALEQEMGPERFIILLREMVRREIATTDDFLILVGEMMGRETVQRYDQRLNQ